MTCSFCCKSGRYSSGRGQHVSLVGDLSPAHVPIPKTMPGFDVNYPKGLVARDAFTMVELLVVIAVVGVLL